MAESSGSGGHPHHIGIFIVVLIAGISLVLVAYGLSSTSGHQANVEFWFRQLYELWQRLLHLNFPTWGALLTKIWNWLTAIGYAVALIALFIIVYSIVRLYELRQREHEEYETLINVGEKKKENARWLHIESLMASQSPSDWRQAIIEADIMLEDVLTKQGYLQEGVGEKLKAADPRRFRTIKDAWEGHKVRNRIAHDGSAFEVSTTLANRTIAHFEAVFREFNVI